MLVPVLVGAVVGAALRSPSNAPRRYVLTARAGRAGVRGQGGCPTCGGVYDFQFSSDACVPMVPVPKDPPEQLPPVDQNVAVRGMFLRPQRLSGTTNAYNFFSDRKILGTQGVVRMVVIRDKNGSELKATSITPFIGRTMHSGDTVFLVGDNASLVTS